MDLKRIFSARVIGLIVLILVVLFLGAVGNMNLEGMEDKKKDGMKDKEGMKEGNDKKKDGMKDKEGMKEGKKQQGNTAAK